MSVLVNLKLDQRTKDEWHAEARRRGMTLSDLIRQAVTQELGPGALTGVVTPAVPERSQSAAEQQPQPGSGVALGPQAETLKPTSNRRQRWQ